LTARDSAIELYDFMDWIMNDCCYKKRIVIAGNHDNILRSNERFMIHDVKNAERIEYLCDSGTEFEGFKIWGSPWTPVFEGVNPHCSAFILPEDELEAKFAMIPDDTDILITHGPPWSVLDQTIRNENVGSYALHIRVAKIQPILHVFGHIHEAYGQDDNMWCNDLCNANGKVVNNKETRYINCSLMDEYYIPKNKPIRIEL